MNPYEDPYGGSGRDRTGERRSHSSANNSDGRESRGSEYRLQEPRVPSQEGTYSTPSYPPNRALYNEPSHPYDSHGDGRRSSPGPYGADDAYDAAYPLPPLKLRDSDAAIITPQQRQSRASQQDRDSNNRSRTSTHSGHGQVEWNVSMPDALEQLTTHRSTVDGSVVSEDYPTYQQGMWQVENGPRNRRTTSPTPIRPYPADEYGSRMTKRQQYTSPPLAPPPQYMDSRYSPHDLPPYQSYPPPDFPPGNTTTSFQSYSPNPYETPSHQNDYPPVYTDPSSQYDIPGVQMPMQGGLAVVGTGQVPLAPPFPVVRVDASNGSLPMPLTQGPFSPVEDKMPSTHRVIPDIPMHKANKTEIRWFASLLVAFYLVSTFYYFYVRFAYTLGQGSYPGYGYFVLAVELMGVSAMVPYALMQWRVTLSNKTDGLPVAPPLQGPLPNPWFHVRVLVPCYKEPLDVVTATVNAALAADLPPCTLRTVYLCDDGKGAEKEEYINKLRQQGYWAEYVTGRTRKPHEVNGKSENLNNTLRNVIYEAFKDPVKGKITKKSAAEIPLGEVIVVFDADMVCKPNFFCKVLEAMVDDEVALCLTPQAFSNVTQWQDLFNNINIQFWQYILPGSNAMGYIACTGTNFCIRARPLASVGFFPDYTITEDYALGMELAKAGYKGTYLNEYLALGEAPTEARNVFRQRSRWTKGHMQVFFSHRCPVFNYKLSWTNKWLYTNGTWAYFATIITTPTFIIVPFISLVFGIHPVAISRQFAIAATIYFFSQFLIQGYVRTWSDNTSLWWSGVSNHVLCFTYFKAVLSVLLSKIGLKRVGFKATDKGGAKPNVLQRVATAARHTAAKTANLASSVTGGKNKKQSDKGCCYFCCCCCFPCCKCCCPNLGDLQGTWDAHVLILSFLFSMVAVGCGALRVYLDGIFQAYTVLPIFWALYNAIPPYLFIHYMFTKNFTFKGTAFIMRMLSVVFGVMALGALWLSTNNQFNFKEMLAGTVSMMDVSRSGPLPSNITKAHPWRGTSMGSDGSDVGVNLAGGFFVNGASNMKWNHPLAGSLAMMAWGYVEFPQAYKKSGQTERFLSNIRWGSEYLMAAHKDPGSFVAQIGDPKEEAQTWVPPEQSATKRPSFVITKDTGGADMFAAASAALSAASIAFNESDVVYSKTVLEKAKTLYELAKQVENTTYCNTERTNIRCYLKHQHNCTATPDAGRRLQSAHTLGTQASNRFNHPRSLLQTSPLPPQETPSSPGATAPDTSSPATSPPSPPAPPVCKNITYSMFYNSTSSYDDLAWAAAWLFKSTNDTTYRDDVTNYLAKHKQYEANYGDPAYYVSNWNNMMWATNTLMFGVTKNDTYGDLVRQFVRTWVVGKTDLWRWSNGNEFYPFNMTLKGVPHAPNQTLPHLSNTLFLSHLYTKVRPGGLSDMIRCWVREQLNYILGKKGSSERSYLVGFGDKYPRQPMSRSASCANPINGQCSWETTYNMTADNPNILRGALVNGPDLKDKFTDKRQLDGNRVGLDNNAGFMGLLAAEMEQSAPEAKCQERHGLYNTMFEDRQVQNKLKKRFKDKLRAFFGL